MKKLGKIITIILVMALFLCLPGMPVAVNGILNLVPADDATHFTAPTQSKDKFTSQSVDTYDLGNWTKPNKNYLVSQQVTAETNNRFNDKYSFATLSNSQLDIANHSPYVIATNTQNMSDRGCYTTNAITLPANGYYIVEVQYCRTTNPDAFGTFYLLDDDNVILRDLRLDGNGWQSATFYLHTDVLESASITPELYFGSRNQNTLGAIYFDNFTVTAVNRANFESAVFDNLHQLKINPKAYYDFSKQGQEYVAVSGDFSNSKFNGVTYTNARNENAVSTAEIPAYLGFTDTQTKFFSKDGDVAADVMLLAADSSQAALTLDGYTFEPKPHEVYMFQFYSIATADTEFNGFYFTITPTSGTDNQIAQNIPNLDDYPYYNGWQLNTIFFVAGQSLNQAYTLGFSLNTGSDNVTGWACIDELKVYKVNGSYAVNNAKSTGVHDTNDLNNTSVSLSIANGNFELGTASDTALIGTSGYPYPLKADEWSTNNNNNGIVNLHNTLWHESFGDGAERPGNINGYDANNNVYMMHNTSYTTNTLTSPALSTTAGSTIYVSFDAFSKTATKTKASIIAASTDDSGNLTDIIHLGKPLKIETNGTWLHYEFSIAEDTYATSRSYYLQFEMEGIGFTYIDNVRASQFGAPDETVNIDLGNPLTIAGLWKATDENIIPYVNAANDGLTLENNGGQKTIIQNDFAYNLSADSYYELIVTTRGTNAYLGLNGYDGLLEVTTDKADTTLTYEYKLYLQVDKEITSTNLQITLGDIDNGRKDGNIFITKIEVNSIDETTYNDAKEVAANSDSRMLILSPAAATEETEETTEETSTDNSFFGENWWYLIPTLITAIALLLAIATFLFHRIKFDKHITKKHTSYARDMRLKNQRNKIVAQKAAKVDNVTDDEAQNN